MPDPTIARGCTVIELFPARRRDRKRFVDLPFSLAKSIEPWHPGLRLFFEALIDPARNPFWEGREAWYFAAIRDGRIVGRMGLLDVGNFPPRPAAAVMLMPDFVDDASVVACLLDAVESRALERGARELVGPMNPNIHHDIGVQVSGFERRNTIFMGYQPPYYARRLEASGFRPLAELQAWELYQESFLQEGRLRRLVDRVERQPSLRIRSVELRRFDRDLAIFFHLYCGAFSDHWGFVPPTWEEFKFIAGDIRHILRANMALVAEWDGQPVGFVLGVPDLYGIIPKASRGRLTPKLVLDVLRKWRRVDEVRVMIAGVLPTHRRYGVHLSLFYRITCAIFDLGFRGGEISWVMKDNAPMAKVLPLLGARPTKTYRLFHKTLG
ncbi:MAG: hypothetical protein WKG32_04455 [Gemmatimonadaceae bacterium]